MSWPTSEDRLVREVRALRDEVEILKRKTIPTPVLSEDPVEATAAGLVGTIVRRQGSQSINHNSSTTWNFTDTYWESDGTPIVVDEANNELDVTESGLYLWHFQDEWAANATGVREVSLLSYGSGSADYILAHTAEPVAAGGFGTTVNVRQHLKITAPHTMYVRVRQTSGGALSLNYNNPLWGLFKVGDL